MTKHLHYTAEPIAHPGRNIPTHVTTIRRTYVSDRNAFMSQNCLSKYSNAKYNYNVYREGVLIFTGKLR